MGIKILVVDDEPDVRDLLANLLADAGYEIEEMTDGRDIVARATSWRPALIILDLTMPNVDGFEALKLLKADPRTAGIPVIVASAQTQKETLVSVGDLGAADFLVKPWEPGEAEWRVGQCLKLCSEERAA
ncbi:MAG: response regulator [Chloroflexi bacterium]|nr:response regulator [Chloroflexota bacterium]